MNHNPSLLLLAFKSSGNSHMLNPLPGLMNISIVHPLRFCADDSENRQAEDISSRVHFISLKIIQNLSTNEPGSVLKLVSGGSIESVFKTVSEFAFTLAANSDSVQSARRYSDLLERSMEKLGQFLIVATQFGLIGVPKEDVKALYLKHFQDNHAASSSTQIDQLNIYFQILFNS